MILRGQNNDLDGAKQVFGPHERNLVGRTMILGGTTECLDLMNRILRGQTNDFGGLMI